jgi:hypothetical protein
MAASPELFYCPSAGAPFKILDEAWTEDFQFGGTDYAFNLGTVEVGEERPFPTHCSQPTLPFNGPLGRNAEVRTIFSGFPDGLEYTVLVSEVYAQEEERGLQRPGQIAGWVGGLPRCGRRFHAAWWATDTGRSMAIAPRPNSSADAPREWRAGFGSNHTSFVNTLMVSGSVRPRSFEVELDVWNALGTRGGREYIDATRF